MMISSVSLQQRVNFDAASRTHFSLFLRRVLATIAPGARYSHNWHIDAIADYLRACERGEIQRLIINMPPRMLKSTLISVAWPAWLLGHEPSQRVMVASYAQSLGIKHSTDCRAVMQAPWYPRLFPCTTLARDQNEKDKFATMDRGYRRAVSVGGAAIGDGGNVLIIDDPINALQAGRRSQRDAVNRWFDHTWATRLDDKQRGVMLVVMQRLHAEDLSGYLLAKTGWEHLSLPAIAPTALRVGWGDRIYSREAGEALHPAREPAWVLDQLKRDLGTANFSAQYQQQPLREAEALVRPQWLVYQAPEQMPEDTARITQSWDTGIKAGSQHDASACATFCEHEGRHYLLDMLVVRQEYPDLKRSILAQAERFTPHVILIEDKASGQSLLQDLKRETDLPCVAYRPDADKVTRLLRITPLLEAGKLVLPTRAAWLKDFEAELLQFPDNPHDDQVDAVSQYFNWLRTRRSPDAMRIRRV
jgi:predicted phage terminase large subunit-like protein